MWQERAFLLPPCALPRCARAPRRWLRASRSRSGHVGKWSIWPAGPPTRSLQGSAGLRTTRKKIPSRTWAPRKCCASVKWGMGTRWRLVTRLWRKRRRCASKAVLRRLRASRTARPRPLAQEDHLVPLILRWASTLGVSILDRPLAGRIAVIAGNTSEGESLALALLLVLASPSVRAKISGVVASGTPVSGDASNQDDALSVNSSRLAKTDRYGFYIHER